MPDVGEYRRSEERALSATLATASNSLLSRQRPDGAWRVDCNAGPATTAYVTVIFRFLGRLEDEQADANARWLESMWLGPGRGFEGYPGAGEGDLGATAAIWAALHACGRRHDSPALADARRFVADHGGEAALLTRFRQGDLAALFLAMAGLLPAARLPAPPPALAIPGIERAIELRAERDPAVHPAGHRRHHPLPAHRGPAAGAGRRCRAAGARRGGPPHAGPLPALPQRRRQLAVRRLLPRGAGAGGDVLRWASPTTTRLRRRPALPRWQAAPGITIPSSPPTSGPRRSSCGRCCRPVGPRARPRCRARCDGCATASATAPGRSSRRTPRCPTVTTPPW